MSGSSEKLEQELRAENRNLQNSLGLKEIETKDLKGQIRALETQLTESENSRPLQVENQKLRGKVEKVKGKLKD
jgi:hypothetical protein